MSTPITTIITIIMQIINAQHGAAVLFGMVAPVAIGIVTGTFINVVVAGVVDTWPNAMLHLASGWAISLPRNIGIRFTCRMRSYYKWRMSRSVIGAANSRNRHCRHCRYYYANYDNHPTNKFAFHSLNHLPFVF